MNLFWCTRTGKGLASPPPNSTDGFSPHSCLSSHNTTDLRAKVTQKLVTSDVQPKDGLSACRHSSMAMSLMSAPISKMAVGQPTSTGWQRVRAPLEKLVPPDSARGKYSGAAVASEGQFCRCRRKSRQRGRNRSWSSLHLQGDE